MPDASTLEQTMRKLINPMLLAALAWAGGAAAQTFPDRPVHIIHGVAAGGTSDLTGRVVADQLQKKWGQSVVVEARPGAFTKIAYSYVAQQAPDGYTLYFGADQAIPNNIVFEGKMDYDISREFTVLAPTAKVVFTLWASDSLPVNSIAELIDYMKKNPGKLNVADTAPNGIIGLAMALVGKQAGAPYKSVPYKGTAPVYVDLVPGRVDVTFDAYAGPVVGLYQTGKVKPLGVTSKQRLSTLPNVPAIAETIPGYDLSIWLGFWGPAGMPPALADRLARDLTDAAGTPDAQAQIAKIGLEPMSASRAQMETENRRSTALWQSAVREFGFKGSY
jgi:tripartite-type tricarboxylate transporter receptor subunit TctC